MMPSFTMPLLPEVQRPTRNIMFLSGTRADFGKLKPLLDEVAHADGFAYSIFATGMHMLSRYGSTVIEIQKAGFDRIFPFINQDSEINSRMDIVLADTIRGLSHYIKECPPDLIVIHGDRVEALAGAIVGSLNNILVAHIEGGELSGTVDELIRHAVTKLSHTHFVANQEARQRLIQLGEASESVFVIGSPDVDVMLSDHLPSIDEVKLKYAIPFADYGICLYHPVTTEVDQLPQYVQQLGNALEQSGMNFVVVYPNNDMGSDLILREYQRFEDHPRFRLLPSMRFEAFLVLLKHTRAILGNSSAGIREAPVYGVPTINIGSRQHNRYHYPSIVNVPNETNAILAALANLPDRFTPSDHFGQGDSAKKFMAQMRRPDFWQTPRQKQFRDLHFAVAAA